MNGAMPKIHPRRDMATATRSIHTLVEHLGTIIKGRNCILLDYPDHDNIGDNLIWLGNKVILKNMLGLDILYQCSYRNIDFSIIAEHQEAVIVCHGGGNFGDLYPQHQNLREDVVARFPGREIVFLPQSIFFQEDSNFKECARRLSEGRGLTLFARDNASLDQAELLVPNGKAALGIDAAFALSYLIPRVLNKLSIGSWRPVFLIRRDRESVRDIIIRNPRALLVDWQDHDQIKAETLDDSEVHDVIFDLKLDALIDSEWEMKSLQYFIRACSLFASASYVVTDRLHGHILSMLLGKRNFVFDNSYGKNANFINTWTADDALVDVLDV